MTTVAFTPKGPFSLAASARFLEGFAPATWAVIGQRVRITQAAAVKQRIATEYGETVDVDGVPVTAFPAPDRWRSLEAVRGLTEQKVVRLRGIVDAAVRGDLDGAALRAGEPAEALARLQRLPGIGPFSAELVLVRGACAPDVFPTAESRLHQTMAELYELNDPTQGQLAEIAERWRPFRSWASVLIRAWWDDSTGRRPTS